MAILVLTASAPATTSLPCTRRPAARNCRQWLGHPPRTAGAGPQPHRHLECYRHITVKDIAAYRKATVFAPSAIDGISRLTLRQAARQPFCAAVSGISSGGIFRPARGHQDAIARTVRRWPAGSWSGIRARDHRFAGMLDCEAMERRAPSQLFVRKNCRRRLAPCGSIPMTSPAARIGSRIPSPVRHFRFLPDRHASRSVMKGAISTRRPRWPPMPSSNTRSPRSSKWSPARASPTTRRPAHFRWDIRTRLALLAASTDRCADIYEDQAQLPGRPQLDAESGHPGLCQIVDQSSFRGVRPQASPTSRKPQARSKWASRPISSTASCGPTSRCSMSTTSTSSRRRDRRHAPSTRPSADRWSRFMAPRLPTSWSRAAEHICRRPGQDQGAGLRTRSHRGADSRPDHGRPASATPMSTSPSLTRWCLRPTAAAGRNGPAEMDCQRIWRL